MACCRWDTDTDTLLGWHFRYKWLTNVNHISICSILHFYVQWIGLRENLQETMVFTIKYVVFL